MLQVHNVENEIHSLNIQDIYHTSMLFGLETQNSVIYQLSMVQLSMYV